MGLQQVGVSVCNDGNVSQIDCTDINRIGPYYRIEVYRASQPSGGYGVTLSGSRVENICGNDHLKPHSNKVFRYVFSVGDQKTHKSDIPILLEGREELNPSGRPDGSLEVRVRDLDPDSDSYGSILIASIEPVEGSDDYSLSYEFRLADNNIKKVRFFSPINARITDINSDLVDLGESLEKLPPAVELDGFNKFKRIKSAKRFILKKGFKAKDIDNGFSSIMELAEQPKFKKFIENLDIYETFGDFGAKGVHPGTNLIGPNAQLASESIYVRAYRVSLILLGRVSSPDMSRAALKPVSLSESKTNTRPGVYAIFIGATINNIGIYKLGLDKVHSDYGGIPMKLAPGSRLENNIKPIVDASRCNQTLGDIANMFYLNK